MALFEVPGLHAGVQMSLQPLLLRWAAGVPALWPLQMSERAAAGALQGPCATCVPSKDDIGKYPKCTQCGADSKLLFRVYFS